MNRTGAALMDTLHTYLRDDETRCIITAKCGRDKAVHIYSVYAKSFTRSRDMKRSCVCVCVNLVARDKTFQMQFKAR